MKIKKIRKNNLLLLFNVEFENEVNSFNKIIQYIADFPECVYYIGDPVRYYDELFYINQSILIREDKSYKKDVDKIKEYIQQFITKNDEIDVFYKKMSDINIKEIDRWIIDSNICVSIDKKNLEVIDPYTFVSHKLIKYEFTNKQDIVYFKLRWMNC